MHTVVVTAVSLLSRFVDLFMCWEEHTLSWYMALSFLLHIFVSYFLSSMSSICLLLLLPGLFVKRKKKICFFFSLLDWQKRSFLLLKPWARLFPSFFFTFTHKLEHIYALQPSIGHFTPYNRIDSVWVLLENRLNKWCWCCRCCCFDMRKRKACMHQRIKKSANLATKFAY